MFVRELLQRSPRLGGFVRVKRILAGELRAEDAHGARSVEVAAVRADEDVERAVERGGFVVHGSVELQEEI